MLVSLKLRHQLVLPGRDSVHICLVSRTVLLILLCLLLHLLIFLFLFRVGLLVRLDGARGPNALHLGAIVLHRLSRVLLENAFHLLIVIVLLHAHLLLHRELGPFIFVVNS